MRRNGAILVVGLFTLMIFLSSCTKVEPVTGDDPVQARFSSASSVYVIHSVEDMAEEPYLNTIVLAEPVSPGQYVVQSNGEIITGVGPVTLDLRTYEALASYRVLEVLKGNDSLVDTEISVSERLFSDGNGGLREPLLVGAGAGKVVLVLHKFPDNDVYYNHIPEYFLIPVADDGTLDIWPYLNRTRARVTLDDFREMCAQAAVQPEEVAQ